MKLVKNRQAQRLVRNQQLFDLDSLVVYDKVHKTILRRLTMLNIQRAFETYLYWRKTGIMNANMEGRIIITFANLCRASGVDPEQKDSITSQQVKEVMADIQHRFDMWRSNEGPMRRFAEEAPLDEKWLKSATKLLHSVFKKRGDVVKLDAIVAFYCALVEDETRELDEVRVDIRRLIKQSNGVFALGAGGSPDVVRLLDEKGKATDAEPPRERAARGTAQMNGSPTKGVQRYTARVIGWGYKSKRDFERAKQELGSDAPSEKDLIDWANKHLH